jgi:hypothetical protein
MGISALGNRKAGCGLVALLLLALTRPVCAQQLIAVEDATFTPAIAADRQPEERITRAAPGAAPYFWTLLAANGAVLDTLRAEGKLPISHSWLRTAGPIVVEQTDLTKLGADIPLDLGTAALVDQLQLEIDRSPQHLFTWRTWSRKGALTPGSWSVFLKYADGTPVICKVIQGVNVPCVYRLEVRAP